MTRFGVSWGRAALGLFVFPVLAASLQVAASAASPSNALSPGATAVSPPARPAGPRSKNPFCAKLGKTLQASAGAQAFCFGASAFAPPANHAARALVPEALAVFGTNVDAANMAEDVTLAGVRGFGQSETAIGAVDNYVVEAWNDSTAFFAPCPSAGYKEEATGYSFSANGGQSFVDLGGLPNNACTSTRLGGDPSVVAYKNSVGTYFYVSSLYNNNVTGVSYVAINACQVAASSLFCGQPIPMAQSSTCVIDFGFTFCSFLDKEFLTLDAKRGRLYAGFSEFGFTDSGRSELAVCDIGTPSGLPGKLGGTAAAPVCPQGALVTPTTAQPKPYLVLSTDTTCENEGNYPDVDKARGDVYDAYEYNWASNFQLTACLNKPTVATVTRVPYSCLVLAPKSTCPGPSNVNGTSIVSMDTAFIPGYNRFPMNDFPRLAVSERYGTASVVWNDTRSHFTGDILLQSFRLGSLAPVQFKPVRLNDTTGSTYVFMPALRNEDHNGRLNVAWYDRRRATTGAQTDVYAAMDLNPTTIFTPVNERVTDVSSDWLLNNSDIVPNFGDYIDNDVVFDPTSPTQSGSKVYVAWSDGRYSVPQPFAAATH